MSDRKKLGKHGEDLARNFLLEKGFEILEQNFYIRGGEMDIIARDNDEYVFVEVKTRTSKYFGEISGQISEIQQRKLIRTAEIYIHNNNLTESPRRIDVITILIHEDKEPEIEYIKNAITFF